MNEKLKTAFSLYCVALSMSKLPGIARLGKRYIKDKTKSKEWNLEYVKKNNERYAKELKAKSQDRSYTIKCAKDKIVECVQEETGFSEKGSRMLVESAIKFSGERGRFETMEYIENMIEIVKLGLDIPSETEPYVYAYWDENGCCTNCGRKKENDYLYCPWCGAEMIKDVVVEECDKYES